VQIDKLLGRFLDAEGTISARTEGINRSIRDIGSRRDVLGRRLDMTEARLRAQFTALDGMIASMTKTSNFLQQQLANLPKTQ